LRKPWDAVRRIVQIFTEAIRIMHPRASFVVALFGLSLVAQAQNRTWTQTAQQLVTDVMYNELRDRQCDSYWQYRSFRVSGSQDVVREQVETSDGPIYRMLGDHNRPLDPEERRREDQRLRDLITRPGAMNRVQQDHVKDEERMKKVIEMLPEAFLYEYEGPAQGDEVRLSFRPNPAFTPATYEARIMHALGGTLIVNQRLKRMVDMQGSMLDRVDFGYGLLGYIEKGGTFEIKREQVSETRWKTSLVEIHIQGKALLFHNVTKDQREARTDFRPVPHDISLTAAKELLDEAASGRTEARLTSSAR
jgi:hypothetical protein